MLDGSITTAKLADGSVTTPKLASGAVTADKIGSGAVSVAKLDSGVLTLLPKGWGLHDGSAGGELVVTGVISSITRTSVGLYVVNFSPSFADTEYAILVSEDNRVGDNLAKEAQSKTVSSYTFLLHKQDDANARSDTQFQVAVWHA